MNLFRKPVVLLDIGCLPEQYKALGTIKEAVKAYEKDFKVKVIPVDYSKSNTMGMSFIPIVL